MGRKEGMGVVWDKEGCGGHVGGFADPHCPLTAGPQVWLP